MQTRSFHALSNRTFPTILLYFIIYIICLSCRSHLSIHPSIPLALLTFPIVPSPSHHFQHISRWSCPPFPLPTSLPPIMHPYFPSFPLDQHSYSYFLIFPCFPISPSFPLVLIPCSHFLKFPSLSMPVILLSRSTLVSISLSIQRVHFPPHHLTPLSKFSLSVYICSGRTFFGTSSSQTCNQTFNCTVYTSSAYNSHLPDNQLANLVTTQCTAIIILTMQHANRNRNTIKKVHGINIAIFFS